MNVPAIPCWSFTPPSWDRGPARPTSRWDHAGHTSAVSSVSWSDDGRAALTASHDGTLRLWDARTGETLWSLEGHAGPVLGAALSPDGRAAWSSGARDGVRAWDLREGVEVLHAAWLPPGLRALSVSPDGARLLALLPSGRGALAGAWLLDASTLRVVARGGVSSPREGVAGFTSDARLAFVNDAARPDGGVSLTRVDARTGAPLDALVLPAAGGARGRARPCVQHRVSRDRDEVVTASTDRPELRAWCAFTGAPTRTIAGAGDLLRHPHLVVGRGWSLGASTSAAIDVHHHATGTRSLARVPSRTDTVTSLAMAGDERAFLAGTAQGRVYRFELDAA